MERSPHFEEKIAEARSMPKETEAERDNAQEAAKLLRMEALLTNGETAEKILAFARENPSAEIEDYETFLEDNASVISPKVTEDFINALKRKRDSVVYVNDMINEDAELKGNTPAEELYERIFDRGEEYSLHGKLELDSDNPFALILYVENEDDYKRIDSRDNIAGSHSGAKPILDMRDLKFETITYPLILVNGAKGTNGTKRILEHELGHAENAALIEAFNQGFGESILEKAKNELLAEMNATAALNYLRTIFERGDIYFDKYFEDLKDLTEEELAEKKAEASEVLATAVVHAAWVVRQYNTFGLKKRLENFKWVLAQIPIHQWKDQLEGTLFIDEAEMMETVIDFKEKLDRVNINNGNLSEEDKEKILHFREILERPFIHDDGKKPLFPVLKKCLSEIDSSNGEFERLVDPRNITKNE